MLESRTPSDTPDDRPAVLILPRHMTSWAELIPIAEALRDRSALRPIMVLTNAQMSAMAAHCQRLDLEVADLDGAIEKAFAEADDGLGRVVARFEKQFQSKPRLGNFLPIAFCRMRRLQCRLDVEYTLFDELCARTRPVAMLVPGDRELSPVPPMLRAALDRGIPSVIATTSLPYIEGVAIPRAESCAFRCAWRDLPPLLNIFAAAAFPGLARATAYGKLVFSPGWVAFALASRGMLPANPWVQGGGHSTFVLQHSHEKMALYRQLGAAEDKMVLIGDQTLDPLYDAYKRRAEIRQELTDRLALQQHLPLVIISMPTEAEHDLCDWDTHLHRQRQFLGKLAKFDANVVICLHPKSSQNKYQGLADDFGFHFAVRPLAQVLPAGDLFICSCSTTIDWAKLCGLPAINLDYLRLDMDLFKEPVGIAEVNTPEEFEAVLPDYLAMTRLPRMSELVTHSKKRMQESMFDGQSMRRIIDFLQGLAGVPTSNAPDFTPAAQHPATSAASQPPSDDADAKGRLIFDAYRHCHIRQIRFPQVAGQGDA